MDRLEHAVHRAARQKTGLAIAIGDVQSSRSPLSDEDLERLRMATGRQLAAALRAEDTVSLFAGSPIRFGVILERSLGGPEAMTVLSRAFGSAEFLVALPSGSITVTFKCGISVAVPPRLSAAGVFREATAALERANEADGPQCTIFDQTVDGKTLERLKLEDGWATSERPPPARAEESSNAEPIADSSASRDHVDVSVDSARVDPWPVPHSDPTGEAFVAARIDPVSSFDHESSPGGWWEVPDHETPDLYSPHESPLRLPTPPPVPPDPDDEPAESGQGAWLEQPMSALEPPRPSLPSEGPEPEGQEPEGPEPESEQPRFYGRLAARSEDHLALQRAPVVDPLDPPWKRASARRKGSTAATRLPPPVAQTILEPVRRTPQSPPSGRGVKNPARLEARTALHAAHVSAARAYAGSRHAVGRRLRGKTGSLSRARLAARARRLWVWAVVASMDPPVQLRGLAAKRLRPRFSPPRPSTEPLRRLRRVATLRRCAPAFPSVRQRGRQLVASVGRVGEPRRRVVRAAKRAPRLNGRWRGARAAAALPNVVRLSPRGSPTPAPTSSSDRPADLVQPVRINRAATTGPSDPGAGRTTASQEEQALGWEAEWRQFAHRIGGELCVRGIGGLPPWGLARKLAVRAPLGEWDIAIETAIGCNLRRSILMRVRYTRRDDFGFKLEPRSRSDALSAPRSLFHDAFSLRTYPEGRSAELTSAPAWRAWFNAHAFKGTLETRRRGYDYPGGTPKARTELRLREPAAGQSADQLNALYGLVAETMSQLQRVGSDPRQQPRRAA